MQFKLFLLNVLVKWQLFITSLYNFFPDYILNYKKEKPYIISSKGDCTNRFKYFLSLFTAPQLLLQNLKETKFLVVYEPSLVYHIDLLDQTGNIRLDKELCVELRTTSFERKEKIMSLNDLEELFGDMSPTNSD